MTDEQKAAVHRIEYFLKAWEYAGVGKTIKTVQDSPDTHAAIDIADLRAILQAATRDTVDEQSFVGKWRATIKAMPDTYEQAATRDAPSADAVDAQRWRYMTTHNATCSVEHMEQLIDGLMAENAARIATLAPKGYGND